MCKWYFYIMALPWVYCEARGVVVQLCVKAHKLQGLSKSSSAKEGSQNNSLSCQMSMTVPNSFLGS